MDNMKFKVTGQVGNMLNGLKKLDGSLNKNKKAIKGVSKGMGNWYTQQKKTNNQLRNLNRDMNRSNKGLQTLTRSFSRLNSVLGIGSIYFFSRGIASAITSAMEMREVNNLFAVSMGELAEETSGALTEMAGITGLDLTNLKEAVGSFSLLARSMGMSTEQASVLSDNMNRLALDFSSLKNIDVNQALQDLRSGLVGQSETLYKYGIDVTEAGLKSEAMAQGINKSVRQMSQGEKMALRYSVIIRQSELAHGDFARTIESPANQLRILKERMVTLARSIGTIFIPVLSKVLPWLNALAKVANMAAQALARLFGYDADADEEMFSGMGSGLEKSAEGANGVADNMGKATENAKKFKKSLMGFDEINTLPSQSDSTAGGGAGGGGAGGIDFGDSILEGMDLGGYDSMISGIKQKSDEYVNGMLEGFGKLGAKLEPFVDLFQRAFGWTLENILKPFGSWVKNVFAPAWSDLADSQLSYLAEILGVVGEAFAELWEDTLEPFASFLAEKLIQDLEFLGRYFEDLSEWVSENEETVKVLTKTLIMAGIIFGGLLAIVKTAIGLFTAYKAVMVILALPFTKFLLIAGAIALIAGFIIANWEPIKEFFKTIGTVIWEAIKSAFNFMVDKGKWAFDSVINIFKGIGQWFGDKFNESKQNFIDDFTAIKNFASTTWSNIKNIFSGIGSWFSRKFTSVKNFGSNAWNGLKSGAKDAWSGIKRTFGAVGTFFSDTFSKAWRRVKDIFSTGGRVFTGIKDGIGTAFKYTVNRLINGINRVVRIPFNGINRALNKIRNVGIFGAKPFRRVISYNAVSVPQIPRLARGGTLDRGQFFEAGEMGKAEAVGSYKGKTTVMPLENTDFVDAMKNAVMEGIISASGSDNSDGNSGIILQVDGRELARASVRNINKLSKREGKVRLNVTG